MAMSQSDCPPTLSLPFGYLTAIFAATYSVSADDETRLELYANTMQAIACDNHTTVANLLGPANKAFLKKELQVRLQQST